jgi:peptidyl-prolyl cis-trans isomerase B (cyclophilin B)
MIASFTLAVAFGVIPCDAFHETAAPLQKEYIPMITPKEGDEVAVLDTSQGTIVLAFLPEKAPGHVKNFKDLTAKGFYDGTKFHRVIPGFMIQGGDPYSKTDDRSRHGTGGPGYQIKAEFNDTPHLRGVLSMARAQDPDSAGSQFFICVKDSRFLDNQYTAFGCVVQGIDVADKIVALPRDGRDNPLTENPASIKSVKIAKWPLPKE